MAIFILAPQRLIKKSILLRLYASLERMSSIGQKRVAVKIILVLKGKYLLGEGRIRLLEGIDRLGCISKAAKELNIPYRVAIRHIRRTEERIGEKLVITRRGGKGGGGKAELTPLSKDMIEIYKKAKEAVERAIKEVLGNSSGYWV